jgi:hypothetical protein
VLRRIVGGSIGDAYFLRAHRLRKAGAAPAVHNGPLAQAA